MQRPERALHPGGTTSGIAESHVEEAALAWLGELGYEIASGLDIGPDGQAPERANYSDVLLVDRVRTAITKLNPTLSRERRTEVLSRLIHSGTPVLIGIGACIIISSRACR